MEQETGIGSLYDEFIPGYGAELRLISVEFISDWTHKPTSPPSRQKAV